LKTEIKPEEFFHGGNSLNLILFLPVLSDMGCIFLFMLGPKEGSTRQITKTLGLMKKYRGLEG
jgi:hypothetical protein